MSPGTDMPKRRPKLLETHFIIASCILATAALGWGYAVRYLELATTKIAVPWPDGTKVDTESFRLVSLPKRLGPFKLAKDGDHEIPEEQRIIMGVGTSLDKLRVDQRRSNWYLSRVYLDTRGPTSDRPPAWRLHVTYYTGGLDTVPHIAPRCLTASGARVLGTDEVSLHIVGLPAPWDKRLPVQRTNFAMDQFVGDQQRSQYYVFSLNGSPEGSWKWVRFRLTDPWLRYCYFAKIQIAPLATVSDKGRMDAAAKEFLGYCLPAILKALPTPQDIEDLHAAHKAKK